MTPYYDKDGITIYCGDCLEIMPQLEPDSIDSVVTDPPYGLSFMGKNWDHGVPGIPFWQAVLTVAKPGAMLLAFGGTRTYHRLTCAIEDAGWEIRDCVMWLYGSGFPKSHDISKTIDKQAGAEREVVGEHIQSIQNRKPGNSLKGSKDASLAWQYNITAPATPAAELWDGWGTALKPSFEPVVLAMAPMPSTFAANALEYGVAGLWVDGCRVEVDDKDKNHRKPSIDYHKNGNQVYGDGLSGRPKQNLASVGRWPANVIHDGSEEVLAGFPVTSSNGKGGIVKYSQPDIRGNNYNRADDHIEQEGMSYGDSGSAARFFYCAKASKRERGDGNNHPTVKPLSLVSYLCRLTRTPTGGIVLDPFCGSGTTLLAARAEGRQAIGIELNEEYCQIAVERLTTPMVSLPSTLKSRNGKMKTTQLKMDLVK